MLKKVISLFALAALLTPFGGAALAISFDFTPTGYVWMNGARYKTNLERNNFNSDLGRIESKIGVNVLTLWAQATIEPYFAYYGVSSTDRHSYYNNSISGIGIQIMPLLGISSVDWLQDLKIFYETLSVHWTTKDDEDVNDNPELYYKEDCRSGVEIWHTWNEPGPYVVENRHMLWGELWAHASYRTTNFGYDKLDNYIAYFQPKVGIYLFKFFDNLSIEPYFKADVIESGKTYSYLNNMDYGVGVRIRPFVSGKLFGFDLQPLKKLKFFVESLAASYLKDNPREGNDFVNHDVRFGIDFDYGR